jgi:acyl-coenzyme A synthetase/AMP-(fatty) acid ligase
MGSGTELLINSQHNIAHICTRRQCDRGLSEKVAMRWISAHQERRDYTFADLDAANIRKMTERYSIQAMARHYEALYRENAC